MFALVGRLAGFKSPGTHFQTESLEFLRIKSNLDPTYIEASLSNPVELAIGFGMREGSLRVLEDECIVYMRRLKINIYKENLLIIFTSLPIHKTCCLGLIERKPETDSSQYKGNT